MPSAVVTGAPQPFGRLVAAALGVPLLSSGAPVPRCDAVVHLGWTPPGPRAVAPSRSLDESRRVFAEAGSAGASSLVVLSSATVYGAWPDNPVPLTEEATLRPNPGVADAAHHAELERMAARWADEHPGASVAVLRAVPAVGPGVDSWFARVLSGQRGIRPRGVDTPRQFVHVDDVVSAVAAAVERRLDGAFNVAPDGWVTGEVVRRLSAGGPSLPLPDRVVPVVARWAWALHLSALPPAVLPLLEHPWVVANDRLRAAGWEPRFTTEEAIVAGRPPSRWREMSPGRRQQVALGASGVALAGVAAGVAGLVARARRRAGG